MAPAPKTAMIPPATTPEFLARHGWGGAQVLPLAGDASFRRYFRVVDGDRTAVLMDAPPEHEDSRPFLGVGAHLSSLGLSVPEPIGVELDKGLLLLEDFGDRRVAPLLVGAPEREAAIYGQAIDVLAALHAHPAPALAPYAEAELLREARLFADWYLPAAGIDEAPGYDDAWRAVWPAVVAATEAEPVLTLRDYHADNLMLLDRPGVRGLGLLDFQDALAGHPAYDLVSLLQDARRDVSPDTAAAMLDAYLAQRPGIDAAAFRTAFDVLGAQRNVKILGVFTRLWKRDGKPLYLGLLPRVWGLVERNLAQPALAPVRDWFDNNVPVSARVAAAQQWQASL